VAAGFPEIAKHDVRRVDEVVAARGGASLRSQSSMILRIKAALGMPEDQARAGFVLNTEEVELRADFAMISTPWLLPGGGDTRRVPSA